MAMRNVLADKWTPRLAEAVAAAVREFAPRLGDAAVALFALDCHPWHGLIELSVLTAAEVAADARLAEPGEIAAWRHYNFAEGLPSWQSAEALGREMRAVYDAATDRAAAAEACLRACARAAASAQVLAALKQLPRAPG